MIKLTTQQLAQILNANLIGDGQAVVENINTDTRKAVFNSLFFALKGEHFDAHQYLDKAVEQGATALVVQKANTNISTPQLVVSDTRLALGQLAKWLREKINPRIVAMTGSSGKTTVKEMTASILQQTAGNPEAVLFTNGNFNNDIGVPLTLLRLTEQHKFAVIELGANHQGEIDYTTHLAQPEAALVNNVAAAHLEGFGSIEGVARAKGEIYRGLTPNGMAIINSEHNYIELWQKEIGSHAIQYFNGGDYKAENVEHSPNGSTFMLVSPKGSIEINLPYLGEHNVKNALAATALAMNVGASLTDVKAGIEYRSQVKGRLFPIQVNENLLLLDDTYNANVDSLQAALDVLKGYDAFRILLVGSTVAALAGLYVEGTLHLLLGGDGKGADFSELADLINQPHISTYCFGRDGKQLAALSSQSHLFETMQQAISFLRPRLKSGDMVLLSPACASLDQFTSFEKRGENLLNPHSDPCDLLSH